MLGTEIFLKHYSFEYFCNSIFNTLRWNLLREVAMGVHPIDVFIVFARKIPSYGTSWPFLWSSEVLQITIFMKFFNTDPLWVRLTQLGRLRGDGRNPEKVSSLMNDKLKILAFQEAHTNWQLWWFSNLLSVHSLIKPALDSNDSVKYRAIVYTFPVYIL